jgi:hypothetical protein
MDELGQLLVRLLLVHVNVLISEDPESIGFLFLRPFVPEDCTTMFAFSIHILPLVLVVYSVGILPDVEGLSLLLQYRSEVLQGFK